MKVEMTHKVNISRSVWGLDGGMTKNNGPIKTTLITCSFYIWGQDWGQDLPRIKPWDGCADTQSYFYFITLNRK